MSTKSMLSTGLALAMTFSGLAMAQEAEEAAEVFSGKHVMLLMDSDSDGKITLEESPEELAQNFQMVDANADGGITLDEAEMIAMFLGGQFTGPDTSVEFILSSLIIGAMDGNGDGKLNRDEASGEIGENWGSMDTNGDGWIDADEGKAAAAQLLAGGGEEEEPVEITAEMVMSNLDTDGDGKITMEEAPEELAANFMMVDMNGDGGIDVTEAETIAMFMNNQ